MITINFHHSTAIRNTVDGPHIVKLLVKVIDTHITNNKTCEAASGALNNLFAEPSMKVNKQFSLISQQSALLLMALPLLNCL